MFHPNLKSDDLVIKNELNNEKIIKKSLYEISYIDELKFKLTINDISNKSHKPKFAGSLKFPKKIILNPQIKYTFGMWERENNQMYLTIIPTENIYYTTIQKRIWEEANHIQVAINDYFKKQL